MALASDSLNMGARVTVHTTIKRRHSTFICFLIHDTPIFCLSKQQAAAASAIVKNQAIVAMIRNFDFPRFKDYS